MSKTGALITCLVSLIVGFSCFGLSKFCQVAELYDDWFPQSELCQLPLQMLGGLAAFYAVAALVVVVYNEK